MADQSRLIELTINLKDAQAEGSLQDMKDAANQLKDALMGAEKGAEGFSQATVALSQARGELKEFNIEARGFTLDQQIMSTVRLANGFVGGITAMKGAMTLFGTESNAEMQKVMQTMVSLIAVMHGLEMAAKAFGERNMAAFKSLLLSVQSASAGMKVALASTGIGLLVIAVGEIVSNWAEISKWTKEVLGIEKDLTKEAQDRIKYQDELLKIEDSNLKIVEELSKLTGNHTKELQEQEKIADLNLKNAKDQLIVAQEANKLAEEHVNKIGFLRGVWATILESAGFYNQAQDVINKQLTKNAETVKQTAETEKEKSDAVLLAAQQQVDLATQLTKDEKRLFTLTNTATEDQIKLLGVYKENEIQIYELKKKIAQSNVDEKDIEINRIEALLNTGKLTGDLLKQEQDRLKMLQEDKVTLENNVKLITAQENEYKRLQTIDTYRKDLNHQIAMHILTQKENTDLANDSLEYANQLIGLVNNEYNKSNTLTKEFQTLQEQLTKGVQEYWQEWHSLDDQLYNADEKLKDISQRLSPSGIRLLNSSYEDVLNTLSKIGNVSKEALGEGLQGQIVVAKQNLNLSTATNVEKIKGGQQAIEELAIQQLITKVLNDRLTGERYLLTQKVEYDQKAIDANKKQADEIQAQIDLKLKLQQKDKDELAFLTANGVKGKELVDAQNKSQEKQEQLNSDIITLGQQQNKNTVEGNELTNKKADTERQIADVDGEILSTNEKLADTTQKTTTQLVQQAKLVQQLADFYKKNQQLVERGQEVLQAGLEIFAKTAQNKLNSLQAAYQQWQADTKAEQKAVDNAITASQSKLDDLAKNNDALLAEEADADAARLGIIQQEIQANNKKAIDEAKNQKILNDQKLAYTNADIDRQNAIARAQYEADKRQKTVNIVNAAMDSALAVIKAAPNPILMIAAGIAGAAATATIASQSIPKPLVIPHQKTLAEGGPLQGPSHAGGGIDINAEGGEWIAPKWMTSNPQTAPVIDSLEAFRQSKPHFAEGGTVPTGIPASPATQNVTIDYDRLAMALQKAPIFVSIKEIRDANRKFLNVIYNKSSI
jgi:hypothetical protein